VDEPVRNERLAAAMRQARVSQVRLAAEAGVDPKTVERWITTGRIPHPKHRDAVAAFLEQPPSSLWDVDGTGSETRTAKPVELRPYLQQAFEADDVRIDFVGYTSETLHGAIAEPLDMVRNGRYTPKSICIRVLLPDMARPLAFPVSVSGDPADDERARARMTLISDRHLGAIRDAAEELHNFGFVDDVSVEARFHGSAPSFKAYIINDRDVFFGFYLVTRHEFRDNQGELATYGSMGKDSELFHYVTDDPESTDSLFATQARRWFESLWDTIARVSS
jgi:transcriptional regulator with XRE-family HTH domain